MLDSALRDFGIPSEGHILHGYAHHLNLILVLRVVGSLLIVWGVLKKGRLSKFNIILGLIGVVVVGRMLYMNYMYLVLE